MYYAVRLMGQGGLQPKASAFKVTKGTLSTWLDHHGNNMGTKIASYILAIKNLFLG